MSRRQVGEERAQRMPGFTAEEMAQQMRTAVMDVLQSTGLLSGGLARRSVGGDAGAAAATPAVPNPEETAARSYMSKAGVRSQLRNLIFKLSQFYHGGFVVLLCTHFSCMNAHGFSQYYLNVEREPALLALYQRKLNLTNPADVAKAAGIAVRNVRSTISADIKKVLWRHFPSTEDAATGTKV